MPRSKPAAKTLPLGGCNVAIAGSFPGMTQSALTTSITSLGGAVPKSVSDDTTCLISTPAHVAANSIKVEAALSNGIPIVSLQWLTDCTNSSSKVAFKAYLISPSSATPTDAPSEKAKGKRRAESPVPSPVNSPVPDQQADQPPQNKKQKGTAKKAEPTVGEASLSKSRDIVIPLDEGCPLSNYRVHIDDQGIIYDASLNQSNAMANNNKFYRVQLVHDPSRNDYKTWTRWGRVGEHGQSAVLGNGSLEDAQKQYEKKFKDKSGLKWADRGADPKPGKYAYVERNYGPDSDDDGDASDDGASAKDDVAPVECTLDIPVQNLMQLIFNQQYINATMSHLNYDANKMPLGKLSDATINRGFRALKDLAAILQGTGSRNEINELSNRYYSLIPHDFGRNRPPIIADSETLKKELELLESLGDLKEAARLMKNDLKDTEKIHTLDRQFQGLGLEEMTVLDPASAEYQELSAYLFNTRGATHSANYQIQSIFRIQRDGELERFSNSEFAKINSDRRLLWHGSRATNFGGILSQGLRIAPPEAPVSGYAFGKGIYLADMSSKSANYCASYISGGQALLLLCEAELGNPLQKLINPSYSAGEDARTNGSWSTWGQGQTGPNRWKDAKCVHPSLAGIMMPDTTVLPGDTDVPGAYLLYNEYIAYDVAQVRLRYLFRVTM